MTFSCAIVWLTRDFRLTDHPAFTRAVQAYQTVIPVVIWDPQLDSGMGAASKWWLHHTLNDFSQQVAALGGGLVIRHGLAQDVLLELIDQTGATALFTHRRYSFAQHQKVASVLKGLRIETHLVEDATLCDQFSIYNKAGGAFKVFTPFYNCVQSAGWQTTVLPKIDRLGGRGVPSLLVSDLHLVTGAGWEAKFSWEVGETAAKHKLDRFIQEAALTYESGRNDPTGLTTSQLSPYLAFGQISPRQIVDRLRQVGFETEAFYRQLIWREFAQYVVWHFPHAETGPFIQNWQLFEYQDRLDWLQAWQRGQTGYPLIDAGMRELWATGWMHNRVRMVVASFLTKHLGIDWQLGAAWFWDTLVDADLANNTMGWQWCAGCGVDAQPYYRIFNPITQGKTYDSEGIYVKKWIPELRECPSKWIHEPWQCGDDRVRDYAFPIVALDRARQRALQDYERFKRN